MPSGRTPFLRKAVRASALAAALLATACSDEKPSEAEIAALLEASANQQLAIHRAARAGGGSPVPDAVRIVNLKSLGGVNDSRDVYVVSVQFDLMVDVGGARMLSQKGTKARLKLGRSGADWRILDQK